MIIGSRKKVLVRKSDLLNGSFSIGDFVYCGNCKAVFSATPEGTVINGMLKIQSLEDPYGSG